ncbi:MAG: response regulator [Kiritimatiellia bacterium]|nr:response regulator [Kiritimatiellia bacterium]
MNKKILIIDDQDEVRRFLQRAGETLGYDIKTTDNGREGLELCLEWKPDAVLTDIFMPDQDGLETIRALRKSYPEIRILAMSGGGSMGHVDVLRTARAMGAAGVLTKPFNRGTLAEVLQQLFAPSPEKSDG